MIDATLYGFSTELMKLAVGTVVPDPQDPNLPWRSDSEARGIKQNANLPSKVPTGHLGAVGGASKSTGEDDPYLKGQEQSGSLESD